MDPSDFECTLCLKLLVRPTTTSCGHSFCLSCLAKSLKHRAKCPICRACLHASQHLTPSTVLTKLLETAFPEEYKARLTEMEELQREQEEEMRSVSQEETNLACFVLSPILPKQRMQLHIFEPRYRLMTRRSLEGSRRFGMVPRSNPTCGTEVEIVEAEELPGGRFYLEVQGIRVFHIVNGWETDGYLTARVRYIDLDLELAASEQASDGETLEDVATAVEELEDVCNAWQQRMLERRVVSNDVMVRLLRELGPIPPRERPGDKVLWMAALVNPVYGRGRSVPDIRVEVLQAKSVRERQKALERALQDSLIGLQSHSALLRSLLACLRKLFSFTVRYSWLVVVGWVLRGQGLETS